MILSRGKRPQRGTRFQARKAKGCHFLMAAEGSSVREAFRLMALLLAPRVPVPFLDLSARLLQRRHAETVFEERAVQRLCAFPACGNHLDG